jgi:hypothetical protein
MANFMKIYPVGAELLHADRQIDITKLTVAFRCFANSPKIGSLTNTNTNTSSRVGLQNLLIHRFEVKFWITRNLV